MTHALPYFFTTQKAKDVAIIGEYEDTITYATEHFIQTAKAAIRLHGSFYVALSGGSTPNAIYAKLATSQSAKEVDWSKVYLFWSDERSVPPTNEDSNFLNAMNAGLKKLPINPKQIFRMHAETDIEAKAKEYEGLIKHHLGLRPFDLIMLGMGDDGHTASLFPETQALKEERRLVVANTVPQKNTERMTMTYPCINKARNIVIYVLGSKKQEMIQKVLLKENTPPFPIESIGNDDNKALFILDKEASTLIHKKG